MNHKELTPEAVMIELNRLKTDTYPTTDFDRRDAALDRAKQAVRKRIPRKPDLKPKPLKNETFWWQCPSCKAHMHTNTMHNFCHHCGQALDWGGNPDE